MRVERTVQITNPEGMHARPSGSVVAIAQDYQSDLRISCGALEVNGRSILELITLGATCGSRLHLSAEGEDAEELVERLAELIGRGFRTG